ncbi:hypothetical protein scyTo_0013024, partial [Scyliorhinus torazame]|nr:hypothetical protein [Scyliorhinus torazame]
TTTTTETTTTASSTASSTSETTSTPVTSTTSASTASSTTKLTSTTVSTTASTIVTITEVPCNGVWSGWVNNYTPTLSRDVLDREPLDPIRNTVCSLATDKIAHIQCEALRFPGSPINQTGDIVSCDLNDGLANVKYGEVHITVPLMGYTITSLTIVHMFLCKKTNLKRKAKNSGMVKVQVDDSNADEGDTDENEEASEDEEEFGNEVPRKTGEREKEAQNALTPAQKQKAGNDASFTLFVRNMKWN